MKKILYVLVLMAGFSIAAVNVSNAQDTKVKASCCLQAKANAMAMQQSNCPMKGKATALNQSNVNCPRDCPMAGKKNCPMAGTQNCPKAGTKDCPNPNCPLKAGAVASKKPQAKTGPVAEAKLK